MEVVVLVPRLLFKFIGAHLGERNYCVHVESTTVLCALHKRVRVGVPVTMQVRVGGCKTGGSRDPRGTLSAAEGTLQEPWRGDSAEAWPRRGVHDGDTPLACSVGGGERRAPPTCPSEKRSGKQGGGHAGCCTTAAQPS